MYYDPAATGERIQNLRKDREVTQEQLAIDLNISDRYMRNLEKGEKVPSVDLFAEHLQLILQFLLPLGRRHA